MGLSFKNITKNVLPSAMILTFGVIGAYTVYNVYFSDRIANSLAGFEPAAGEIVNIEPMINENKLDNGFPPFPEAHKTPVEGQSN